MQVARMRQTFAERLSKLREEAMSNGPFHEYKMFEMLIEGTEIFLKFLKLRSRTNEDYEPTQSSYHGVTGECPASEPGCDSCYACTKFLEQHIHIWDFVDNEAPEGEPPQSCLCGTLRKLSGEEPDFDKLAELHGAMVMAFEEVRPKE